MWRFHTIMANFLKIRVSQNHLSSCRHGWAMDVERAQRVARIGGWGGVPAMGTEFDSHPANIFRKCSPHFFGTKWTEPKGPNPEPGFRFGGYWICVGRDSSNDHIIHTHTHDDEGHTMKCIHDMGAWTWGYIQNFEQCWWWNDVFFPLRYVSQLVHLDGSLGFSCDFCCFETRQIVNGVGLMWTIVDTTKACQICQCQVRLRNVKHSFSDYREVLPARSTPCYIRFWVVLGSS